MTLKGGGWGGGGGGVAQGLLRKPLIPNVAAEEAQDMVPLRYGWIHIHNGL